MSDRSIAEIIGWTPCNLANCDADHPDPYSPHWVDAKYEYARHGEPTVDDLLAWLSWDMFFEAELIVANGFVSVEFKNTDSGLDGDTFDGDTLLAALEAAVRAVDSRWPVGGVVDDGTTTDGGTQ